MSQQYIVVTIPVGTNNATLLEAMTESVAARVLAMFDGADADSFLGEHYAPRAVAVDRKRSIVLETERAVRVDVCGECDECGHPEAICECD